MYTHTETPFTFPYVFTCSIPQDPTSRISRPRGADFGPVRTSVLSWRLVPLQFVKLQLVIPQKNGKCRFLGGARKYPNIWLSTLPRGVQCIYGKVFVLLSLLLLGCLVSVWVAWFFTALRVDMCFSSVHTSKINRRHLFSDLVTLQYSCDNIPKKKYLRLMWVTDLQKR
jgi:hypothetical protein